MATNREIEEKVLYPELSYSLTGLLFNVHNELGQFAREKQYGDLIEKKLKELSIKYKREFSIGSSGNIVDFVIDDKIVLELKATRTVTGDYYRQVQNYLQQMKLQLGVLVNKYLKPMRIVNIESIRSN
jgi:GxxExxY protein